MNQDDKQVIKKQIQKSLSQILQHTQEKQGLKYQQTNELKQNEKSEYKKVFLIKQQSTIFSLSISKNNQLMASGGEQGEILLWDLQKQVIKQTYFIENQVEKGGIVNSLDFSFDNKYLGAAYQKLAFDIIFIYDVQNIQNLMPKFQLKGHEDIINFVKFSIDSQFLMSGSLDRTLRIWNMEQSIAIQEFKYEQEVVEMAESFNSQIITSNLEKGLVILYEKKLKTFSKIFEWSPHGETDQHEGRLSTAFSEGQGEEYLYTSFAQIKIWSVKQLLTTNLQIPLKVFQEQEFIFGPIYPRCNNKQIHSCLNQIVYIDTNEGGVTLVDEDEYYFSYPSFDGQYIVGSNEENLYLFILNSKNDE